MLNVSWVGQRNGLDIQFANAGVLDSRITFSRTTNATMFDATGKLTFAPNNLLTYSEDLSNVIWSKSAASSSGTTTAPTGGSAQRLKEDATTNYHGASNGGTIIGSAPYIGSVYVKAGERTAAYLDIWQGTAPFAPVGCAVDLTAGTITASNGSPTIQSVGDGWYRINLPFTSAAAATASSVRVYLLASNYTGALTTSGVPAAGSYAGDNASGIYVWGAQLERVTYETTPRTYNATTASAYYGPRLVYDPEPTSGPHNLLTYSNDSSNVAWNADSNGKSTYTGTMPDSSTGTINRFVSTIGGTWYPRNTSVTLFGGTTYTLSVYVKGIGQNPTSAKLAIFDGSWKTSTAITITSSWQLVTFTFTAAASSATGVGFELASPASAGYGIDWCWAQLNYGSSALTYAPTTSAALFYPAALGLQIEEARTNLAWPSKFSGWATGNCTSTADAAVSPDGTSNATLVTTTNISHVYYNGFTVTASTAYVWSFWAKRGTMTDMKYAVYNSTGAAFIISPTSYYSQTNSATWTRVTVAFTTPVGCTSVQVYGLSDSGVTGTAYLWGAQLEAGAFVTSLVPTATASAARSQEDASIQGLALSSFFNAANGTIMVESRRDAAASNVGQHIFAINDNTTNNAMTYVYRNLSSNFTIDIRTAGVSQIDPPVDTGTETGLGTSQKVALAYAANDVTFTANGTTIKTDNTVTLPSGMDRLIVGARGPGAAYLNGTIKRLTYYRRRLSNAELQDLTT